MNYQLSTIYLGADHAGYEAKEALKSFLAEQGHTVDDLGATKLDPDDDYPQFAHAVAEKVAADPDSRGILLCGNGQGVCIAANKVAGIRAISSWNPEHAKTTRTDDDANVLCLAARHLDQATIEAIVTTWLATPFSNEPRHVRRIQAIDDAEQR